MKTSFQPLFAFGLALGVAACGDDGGDNGVIVMSEGPEDTAGGDDDDDDVALAHGVVKLAFERSPGEADNPYVGTALIEASLTYEVCLIDFYENNPGLRQTGPEGALVFGSMSEGGEGWLDRLCDGGSVDCTVESFQQQLGTMANFLTVRYAVGGSEIEDREVQWGPIPLAQLAACEGGGAPTVRVGIGAVRGVSASGDTVWEMKSVDPDRAQVGQGQAIAIRAGLPN